MSLRNHDGKITGGDLLQLGLVQSDSEGTLSALGGSQAALAPAPSGDTTGVADTAALQVAINAAAAAVKRLDLLQGTYYITQLTLPSRAHIRGQGRELTIIKQAAGTDLIGITNANPDTGGNSDITLESLQLDGNKANRTSSKVMCVVTGTAAGVQSGNCSRIYFRDIYAHDAAAQALVFQNVRGGAIRDCHVGNCGRDGISVYFDSQDVVISDCYVHDCADDFIGLNAEDASSTGHVMARIAVTNCVLGGGGTTQGSGLAVRGVINSVFANLIIYQAFSAGVTVSNANTTAAAGLDFSNIVIVDAGANNSGGSGHGIEIQGATSIIGAGGAAGVSDVRFKTVHITNPRAHGLVLSSGGASGTITDVTYDGVTVACGTLYTAGRGVHAPDGRYTRIRFRGVVIRNAQGNGANIGHATNATADITFDGCFVTGSGTNSVTSAISLTNVNGLMFTRNKCSGGANQTYGLAVATPTGDYTITENDCTGNATGTFSLSGMASCTDIRIRDNTGYSPWVGSGAVGSLTNVVAGGTTTYFGDLAVTFGTPFPTGVTPHVYASVRSFTGAYAEISAVTNTGCTVRACSARSDLGAVTVDWRAEP